MRVLPHTIGFVVATVVLLTSSSADSQGTTLQQMLGYHVDGLAELWIGKRRDKVVRSFVDEGGVCTTDGVDSTSVWCTAPGAAGSYKDQFIFGPKDRVRGIAFEILDSPTECASAREYLLSRYSKPAAVRTTKETSVTVTAWRHPKLQNRVVKHQQPRNPNYCSVYYGLLR